MASKKLASNGDIQKPTSDDLDNRYTYHSPKGDQPERYEHIRTAIRKLAKLIVANTPACAEQDRALNHLDLVMFLANAAIARNEQ